MAGHGFPRGESGRLCYGSSNRRSPPIAAFRFVHTADIHLDSPLRSLALRDAELADLIGAATRTAFSAIIDLCLDEQVDALIIAGDLYDGDQTSMKTARFLAGELGRLAQAGIRTFLIRGNHDALSRISKELVLPETVKLFGGRSETVIIERDKGERPVAVHGLSFSDPTAPESLVPRYRPAVADAINIGIMHTSLGGAPGHDAYAPCSPAELQALHYDYWALGHIHKRGVIEGPSVIVMPGMPQGRDIGEDGPKSATLASIMDDGTISIEERPTALAEFSRIRIDISGIEAWDDLAGTIGRQLTSARQLAIARELVVRLTLTGTTPLAWRMRRDADLLFEEARARANRVGSVWIEKLDIDCEPPPAGGHSDADPLVEMQAIIKHRVLGSQGFEAAFAIIAEQLQGQLPTELRDLFGRNEAETKARFQRLSEDGAELVLARLRTGPAGEIV
jgi:exonuclease SbcD